MKAFKISCYAEVETTFRNALTKVRVPVMVIPADTPTAR